MGTILYEKTVKTRKPHRCWGCAMEYPIGSYMRRLAQAGNGTVDRFYICEVCQEYESRHHDPHDDGYGYGDIYSNDREGWEELRMELGVGD